VIILVSCLLLLLVAAVAPRSDLRRLSEVRLRHTWLVWVALVAQVLVISVLPGDHQTLSAGAHLASYAVAGVFAFANRGLPGALVVAAGGALNFAAIAANGGTMPATAEALHRSGWQPAPGHFANSAVVPHARLSWLGDVFATPSWLPIHSVFSVGDILVVLGVAVFLQRCTRQSEEIAALVPQG
jgi:hypothetical protein